jgi:serine/threonine protein kinase
VTDSSNRGSVVKTGDIIEGRYRIIETLGEGSMGAVFLAEHVVQNRRVALKLLRPELGADAAALDGFMTEARAAGTLGHPSIVACTDTGLTHAGVPYVVLEYLEGALLTDEVYRVGGLPVRRALKIADQIASALAAAHDAGIVHRGLKSDSVFLIDEDDALDIVKVLDFGAGRFLAAPGDHGRRGRVLGSPEFMAPEQVTSPGTADHRADIYALGVILYEMLTARRPFSDDDRRATADAAGGAPGPRGDDRRQAARQGSGPALRVDDGRPDRDRGVRDGDPTRRAQRAAPGAGVGAARGGPARRRPDRSARTGPANRGAVGRAGEAAGVAGAAVLAGRLAGRRHAGGRCRGRARVRRGADRGGERRGDRGRARR